MRKKLIEVSIPLEAINKASAREKSIRHGHPSTLHLWWARRPLAACRAVLFAQLVDDPSAWPDRFPTEVEQDAERKRLHKVIERLVHWEASNDKAVLNAARWEIARSVAWALGEEPPSAENGSAILAYLQAKAPPVYDPFSGGGSIPLEAQRLGMRAYGSDLNPVAVLIGKALVEIPPKFAGRAPVNPMARGEARNGALRSWNGAQGLAADVDYYGAWMREEAKRRIGHLYPSVILPDGSHATVIAWLWARTVRSPDPAAKGAMVPLISSFLISAKEGKKAWVETVFDAGSRDGYRFEVKSGTLRKSDEERLLKGTKSARGNFACLLTGASISEEYNRSQGATHQLGHRLLAIVAEGPRGRVFVGPNDADEALALGMTRWGDLFTDRQLVALTTLSEMLEEIRLKIVLDSIESGLLQDGVGLEAGGFGANAYAEAIVTYLAFLIDQLANHSSLLCGWNSANTQMRSVFSRQALSMTWDYAEVNIFSESSGSFSNLIERMVKAFSGLSQSAGEARVGQAPAQSAPIPKGAVIATDPPYYDNIGYADLSDFFYAWLRPGLVKIWPDLFRRLLSPKDDELVATPHRHGGTDAAHSFFMEGMGVAIKRFGLASGATWPLTIFYAFKQSENSGDGITSAGWSSFLQAVIDSGLMVDGTWPLNTEKKGRVRDIGTNALASSIVLVCRKRDLSAAITTRAEFIRALKREMPGAIDDIRKAGVGPVDMQQSVIGPGMGIFTRFSKVLEDDDSVMNVRTALTLINRVWEEIENELDAAFDPATQVALSWFATYGFDSKTSGELITLANAKNIPLDALFSSGVFRNLHGRAGLIPRTELPPGWTPATDRDPTVWECVQHTARVLAAADGGAEAAAALVGQMGRMAADARTLAYRLFEIATKKSWSAEALIYNELAEGWPHLEDLAPSAAARGGAAGQADMFRELG